jgi:hypothetical protein
VVWWYLLLLVVPRGSFQWSSPSTIIHTRHYIRYVIIPFLLCTAKDQYDDNHITTTTTTTICPYHRRRRRHKTMTIIGGVMTIITRAKHHWPIYGVSFESDFNVGSSVYSSVSFSWES